MRCLNTFFLIIWFLIKSMMYGRVFSSPSLCTITPLKDMMDYVGQLLFGFQQFFHFFQVHIVAIAYFHTQKPNIIKSSQYLYFVLSWSQGRSWGVLIKWHEIVHTFLIPCGTPNLTNYFPCHTWMCWLCIPQYLIEVPRSFYFFISTKRYM